MSMSAGYSLPLLPKRSTQYRLTISKQWGKNERRAFNV
jgi:hypothetical protein